MTLTNSLTTSQHQLTANTESEQKVFLRHSLLKLHLNFKEVSTAFNNLLRLSSPDGNRVRFVTQSLQDQFSILTRKCTGRGVN